MTTDASNAGADRVEKPALGSQCPLLVAAGLIVLINAINIERLVTAAAPRDPWESIEVIESWRSLNGQPLYDPSPSGHTPHMYGALAPVLQGALFRWTGVNNRTGKGISVVTGLLTVTLLALAMAGRRSLGKLAIVWALFLALNHRSGNYLAENRPDMISLLFSVAGVLCLALGHESKRWLWVVAGSSCLVLGFFFKQTAAVLAIVPLIALGLRGWRPTRAEVVFGLLPAAVMAGVVVGLKVYRPAVYQGMIVNPKQFALNAPGTVRAAWELLIDMPLFLFLTGEWIMTDQGSWRERPRMRWTLATLAVTFPFSAVAAAKAGGTANSLLPALLTMTAFCALRLPLLIGRRDGPATRPRRMLTVFLAVLMLMSAFPRLSRKHGLFEPKSGRDAAYERVVNRAEDLPGTVICPEDPTLPFYAKKYVGQNIYVEYDCHLVNGEWPEQTPERMLAEIHSADYLIDVRGWWQDLLNDETLRALGFEPVDDAAFDESYYRLWRNARPPRTVAEQKP